MSKQNKLSTNKVCCFCGLSDDNEFKFGKFCEHNNIVTHYYCLLLSSNMEQRGNDHEGILGFLEVDIKKELRRGKRLLCTYCKKNGATLGCCNKKCKRMFHYPCGLGAGALNQFFGEFRSFCITHRPKQRIDIEVKKELTRTGEVMCYICYDQVDPNVITDTIWAPCCKKNTWFHRKCIQQLALSAGYFFKCPLCNDKRSFHQAMLEFGIFIPSQDASWELVPNAFEELLYRYDQCDAAICLCPKGRKHTSFNAKWELVLCRTCGSQGIHMACGQLKWANPTWECKECISILGKSMKSINSNTTERILQNNSDLEDSDSDISVGKVSPVPFVSSTPNTISDSVPCVSNTKLRPGPRSFHLKQLRTRREIQNLQLGSSSKEIDNKIDTVSESIDTKEHSVQVSTCSKEDLPIEVESSLVNESKNNTNSLTEHFKSQSPADDDIIIDSNDDIIQVNEIKKNVQSRNNVNGHKENNVLLNTTSVTNDISLQTNNSKENDASNFLINNVNIMETNNDDLEDTIVLNQKSRNINIDPISNIKIINVVSLAPEEFEKVPSMGNEHTIDNVTLQNDILDTNLKRKFDKTSLYSTPLLIQEPKKMKTNGNIYEENQKLSYVTVDVRNTCKSRTYLNNIPTFTSDNYLQINNNNEKCNSTNASNLQSLESYIQMKKRENENLLPQYTFNVSHLSEVNTLLNESDSEINILSEYKNKNNGCNMRKCDGDAGTSPAAKSRNGSLVSDAKIDYTARYIDSTHSHPKSERSYVPEQRKPRNNIKTTAIPTNRVSNTASSNDFSEEKDKSTGSDHPRLIPEYVHLRDLKFRVYNSNNLQMILYNKFSVNINIENISKIEKNNRLEASIPTAVQQKFPEIQSEASLSVKSENIIHNISSVSNKDKTKSVIINDQPRNYHDDTKENMDPVTAVPCKGITDSLLANTNLATYNLTTAISSSNQSEDRNTTQSTHNESKVIEQNNTECSQQNDNLNNVENIFDALTNSNKRYKKSINNITQSIQHLNSSCVTSTMTEKNNFHNSTKPVQHTLFTENRTNYKSENTIKNITTASQFKVSIDLKKIEKFVNNNPNLFAKCETKND